MCESGAEEGGAGRHPWWLWPNLLSLDAPLVAVTWQWLFAEALRARLPLSMYVLLGGTVWLIYVVDRLLDVRRFRKATAEGKVEMVKTARHAFYERHRVSFAAAATVVLIALAVATPFLVPGALIARAAFLFVQVGLYFKLVSRPRDGGGIPMTKKIFCGLIFALGVTIAPSFYGSLVTNPYAASVQGFLLEWGLALYDMAFVPTVLFGVLCALNCVAISIWEGDTGDRVTEAARSLERRLWLLAIAGLIAAAYYGGAWGLVYLCVSGSALGLLLLGSKAKERTMSQNALRVLADAVLMTPVLVLVLVLFG